MNNGEQGKFQPGDLTWEEVYPSLKGEMMREAQAHFSRYLQVAFEIVEAHHTVGQAIDTRQSTAMIKERSKGNNF
jgi:hypothetical protein